MSTSWVLSIDNPAIYFEPNIEIIDLDWIKRGYVVVLAIVIEDGQLSVYRNCRTEKLGRASLDVWISPAGPQCKLQILHRKHLPRHSSRHLQCAESPLPELNLQIAYAKCNPQKNPSWLAAFEFLPNLQLLWWAGTILTQNVGFIRC